MFELMAITDDSSVKLAAVIVSLAAFLASIFFYFRNRKTQEKIAQATLIQKLHENAAAHKNIVRVLEKRLEDRVAYKNQNPQATPIAQPLSDDEKAEAREFLRFLEMLMLILEGGIIKSEDIFPLFAFRIFLAVNDPEVRSTFLVDARSNGYYPKRSFCSLYALHHRLLGYFSAKYGSDFPKILEEIHVYRENDLSWHGYYTSGVQNYVQHRWQPFERKKKKKVNPTIYENPGWPI